VPLTLLAKSLNLIKIWPFMVHCSCLIVWVCAETNGFVIQKMYVSSILALTSFSFNHFFPSSFEKCTIFQSAMRRRLHISNGPLSLGVPLGQHGFSNILLSNYLRRPICSVPCRTTAFRCHSFSASGKAIEPAVKAVTVVLTK
jgi:hypothetical protein